MPIERLPRAGAGGACPAPVYYGCRRYILVDTRRLPTYVHYHLFLIPVDLPFDALTFAYRGLPRLLYAFRGLFWTILLVPRCPTVTRTRLLCRITATHLPFPGWIPPTVPMDVQLQPGLPRYRRIALLPFGVVPRFIGYRHGLPGWALDVTLN